MTRWRPLESNQNCCAISEDWCCSARCACCRRVRLRPQGVDLEANRSTEIDAQFRSATSSGVLFDNEPQAVRVPSFDAKSPFGKDKTNTQLTAELSPADRRNRQRFVHALAVSDPDVIFDGGPMLAMGQEDSLFDLVATYRRLPAGKFTTVTDVPAPIAIRTLTTTNSTYVYLMNDSQWPVTLQANVNLPAGTQDGGVERASTAVRHCRETNGR